MDHFLGCMVASSILASSYAGDSESIEALIKACSTGADFIRPWDVLYSIAAGSSSNSSLDEMEDELEAEEAIETIEESDDLRSRSGAQAGLEQFRRSVAIEYEVKKEVMDDWRSCRGMGDSSGVMDPRRIRRELHGADCLNDMLPCSGLEIVSRLKVASMEDRGVRNRLPRVGMAEGRVGSCLVGDSARRLMLDDCSVG